MFSKKKPVLTFIQEVQEKKKSIMRDFVVAMEEITQLNLRMNNEVERNEEIIEAKKLENLLLESEVESNAKSFAAIDSIVNPD